MYTVLQLVFSVSIYIIGGFVNLPYWIGLILSILLIGMAAIGVIATDNTRDYVEDVEDNTATVTRTIKKFNVDIAELLDICKSKKFMSL